MKAIFRPRRERASLSMSQLAGFMTLVVKVLIVIIFVMNLNNPIKKYREKAKDGQDRQQLEALVTELTKVNSSLKEEVNQLEHHLIETKIALSEVESRHHKYRDVIPTLAELTRQLALEKGSEKQTLNDGKNYADLVVALSEELQIEWLDDIISDEIRWMGLLDEWQAIGVRLIQIRQQAALENVSVIIQNQALLWNEIPISQMQFMRLLGNLLDNAVKESKKDNKGQNKTVLLRFVDEGNCFSVRVMDQAPAFELEILQKLGERKNSTNGTGDGYSEVFEILESVDASLKICESLTAFGRVKEIQVSFDGLKKYSISSTYRAEALKDALVGSRFG